MTEPKMPDAPESDPEPREALLARIKAEIASGRYVTLEKLEVSADRLREDPLYFL